MIDQHDTCLLYVCTNILHHPITADRFLSSCEKTISSCEVVYLFLLSLSPDGLGVTPPQLYKPNLKIVQCLAPHIRKLPVCHMCGHIWPVYNPLFNSRHMQCSVVIYLKCWNKIYKLLSKRNHHDLFQKMTTVVYFFPLIASQYILQAAVLFKCIWLALMLCVPEQINVKHRTFYCFR